jgi:hypothetical protein
VPTIILTTHLDHSLVQKNHNIIKHIMHQSFQKPVLVFKINEIHMHRQVHGSEYTKIGKILIDYSQGSPTFPCGTRNESC